MDAIKKTTTWKGSLKRLCFDNEVGNLVTEEGEIIDLMAILKQFYAERVFDIAITAKEEEEIEYEEVLDI